MTNNGRAARVEGLEGLWLGSHRCAHLLLPCTSAVSVILKKGGEPCVRRATKGLEKEVSRKDSGDSRHLDRIPTAEKQATAGASTERLL